MIKQFHLSTISIILIFGGRNVSAQETSFKTIDAETKAKLTVESVCLCDTHLKDLKAMTNDFEEVEVEEMDSPKNCYGQDSRYSGGRGVRSDKFPGMIFQEGDVKGYIGKIRLTKQFRGKLPNGATVDLGTMKLRDVFTIYPALKESWGSRGCSDYWHFSDKTISFFVKIDKSIQPQFPIRETDYLDKPVEGIDLVASCYGLLIPHESIQLFRPGEPMYFIDSIRTNESFFLSAYTPNDIAAVTVIKGENAIRVGGEEARNGIVYIFTRDYARSEYWNFFRKESLSYAQAVQSSDDPDVVYILNGEVLSGIYEGKLFSISKDDLLEIRIINQAELKKQFHTKGKTGVVLKTRESKQEVK